MNEPDLDVLIVGAGLSGIGAAARLGMDHPSLRYAVLEGRSVSGGTWDLFRYPGIRSDSDMFTLGYRFKPWLGDRALADGPSILAYVRETAREYDVERRIRYDHHVTAADWDSETACWTVTATTPDGEVSLTTRMLWSCSGYYDYAGGYTPDIPGLDDFAGDLVHPQAWPEELDHTGKRVVVIGSGATAVTLVPALAESGAAHVTMLQRSPSYVLSLPGVDPVATRVRRWLPQRAAYAVTRWKGILFATGFYQLSRRRPAFVRRLLRKATVKELGADYPVDVDFRPRYDPWDERMCFVPDGDLFRVLRDGTAEVVTDTIERVVPDGVLLSSGRHLDADILVTATGLTLVPFGRVELSVDGEKVDLPRTMAYRALMLAGLPNLFFTVGYTNASWTLKADLVAEFASRVISHLREHGYTSVVPHRPAGIGEAPFMDFTPGYVLRALDRLPVQGDREPWRLRQNYLHDLRTIRRAPLEDGVLRFR